MFGWNFGYNLKWPRVSWSRREGALWYETLGVGDTYLEAMGSEQRRNQYLERMLWTFFDWFVYVVMNLETPPDPS